MYKFASNELARPFSTADVERFNKFLKNIITNDRTSLSEITSESLMLLYNQKF